MPNKHILRSKPQHKTIIVGYLDQNNQKSR